MADAPPDGWDAERGDKAVAVRPSATRPEGDSSRPPGRSRRMTGDLSLAGVAVSGGAVIRWLFRLCHEDANGVMLGGR